MGVRVVKVRILQNFGAYEAGQVFDDWPDGMCEVFIGRGLIEQVREPEPEKAVPKMERKKAK